MRSAPSPQVRAPLRRLGSAGVGHPVDVEDLRDRVHKTLEDVLAHRPDGVFLSNGPGDPEPLECAIGTIRGLRRVLRRATVPVLVVPVVASGDLGGHHYRVGELGSVGSGVSVSTSTVKAFRTPSARLALRLFALLTYTFQIALHSDGRVQYHYGEMTRLPSRWSIGACQMLLWKYGIGHPYSAHSRSCTTR